MALQHRPGLDIPSLDPAVQYYCSKGIAPSTHQTYQSALKRFYSFCSLFNVVSPFPVNEDILCYFASYLATQNVSPQSIKTYLSGIRHTQVTLGLPEPRSFSSLPRLRLVQAGIQRTHLEQASKPSRTRLPITPAILRAMQSTLEPRATDPAVIMIWAAALLCFFGFFRSGEITTPNTTGFNPKIHLAWGDVAIDSQQSPSLLKIRLKRSKTDQFGQGVDIYVGKTGCPLCPVAGVTAYMVQRGTGEGPFFQFADRTPLTKARFTEQIRAILGDAGLPYSHFAGHSFRIGAATAAANAGLEDSTIRTLGRWNSNAFLSYIRTPREQLASLTRCLAS